MARNYQTVNIEIFDGKDNNDDNKEEEDDKKMEDNIDILTVNSYSHVIAITYMHWRE